MQILKVIKSVTENELVVQSVYDEHVAINMNLTPNSP